MHNGSGDLSGLITDGDLRPTLQRHGPQEWRDITAAQIATPHPITVTPEMLAAEALALMERNPRQAISVLSVVAPAQPLRLLGLLRLLRHHDLVQAGFTSSVRAP